MTKQITILTAIVGMFLVSSAMADYTPKSGEYNYLGVAGLPVQPVRGSVGGDGLSEYRFVPWAMYNLRNRVDIDPSDNVDYRYTDYQVVCIDLIQPATSGWLSYEDVDLTDAPIGSGNQQMTQLQANRLRELWTEHYTEAAATAVGRGAFQLAAWEIVYQGNATSVSSYDVASGWATPNGFQVQSVPGAGNVKNAVTMANDWLWHLNGVNDMAGEWYGTDRFLNVRALVNSDVQDWAFYSPDMGTIPAPGAMALGWIGLGLVGWIRRRLA